MKEFCQIKEIDADNIATWSSKFFLTFDIDWCSDEVLLDCINLVESADVPATWFVTHDTPLLNQLRANPKFELGIHPNFNFLLEGSASKGKNSSEVIQNILKIVPESTSVRSHSMTQSTGILKLFKELGLTHDCNHFIPYFAGCELHPWKLWAEGITKVPYFWEDDIWCLYARQESIDAAIHTKGIKVFDFHPIHVYLNSSSMECYESTREIHRKHDLLSHHVNGLTLGTRDQLKTLLGLV